MILIGIIIGLLIIIITVFNFNTGTDKNNTNNTNNLNHEKKVVKSIPLSSKAKTFQNKYGITNNIKTNTSITICANIVS